MTFRAISSGSLEELLEVFYHLIDILRHLIKVRIKDAFALIAVPPEARSFPLSTAL